MKKSNLYSNKLRWKLSFLAFAIILIGFSLFFSNKIVSKVSEREKDRVKNWAESIKKKVELVRLTNSTFSRLRAKERKEMELWIEATKEISKPVTDEFYQDYTFPLKIIDQNKDIPVILMDQNKSISGHINLDFDTSFFRLKHPKFTKKRILTLFEDSLRILAQSWRNKNPSFTIEVYPGLFMSYFYTDSKNIYRLEKERDSLIQAFNKEIISEDKLVPVLLLSKDFDSVIASNLPLFKIKTDKKGIQEFIKNKTPLPIEFSELHSSWLFYDNSLEIKQLQYFPYIQFLLIGLFILIGYIVFSTFRKAEQNQVWAGMAKETAHQLGTPISSLLAWLEWLKNENIKPEIIEEMKKDLDRLELVSSRFSKIGSEAILIEKDIIESIEQVTEYLKSRISSKIDISIIKNENTILFPHNKELLQWVIENLIKNAVDAIQKNGFINIVITKQLKQLTIDVIDNGKGIPKKELNKVFSPGFTTKKRGWGLGLSLVKRIIEEYHKGKIFVLDSQVGKGTSFRIILYF
ncbi:MAG: HAMP domain-containing histidine kinase [Flavobacteriia bacterium]|nr:HAMP domain-containing histidine kinase [Flavobacteriia bacterium]